MFVTEATQFCVMAGSTLIQKSEKEIWLNQDSNLGQSDQKLINCANHYFMAAFEALYDRHFLLLVANEGPETHRGLNNKQNMIVYLQLIQV